MVSRKEVWSWSLYDFANSAYASLIPVLLFPLYYKSVVLQNSPDTDLWWGIVAGVSILLAGLLAPVVGAYADLVKRRKQAFILATMVAVVGTMGIAQVRTPLWASLFFILTNTGFNVALTLYDSLLFNVSTKKNSGSVSNFGWALGYVGGLLCMALIYPLLKRGATDSAYPYSFWIVAVFYLVFALPSFFYVRETEWIKLKKMQNPILESFKSSINTLKNWRSYRHLLLFLIAFYFFSEGIVTLQFFAALYMNTTLHIPANEFALMFIVTQLIAIPATVYVGRKSDHVEHRTILIWTLMGWCVGTVLLGLATGKGMLWIVFIWMGLVLGGSQATARAWFNNLIPSDKRSELFGFNALASKVSATIGPPIFGLISVITGSQRLAVFSILFYFLVSLVLFIKIKN